MPHPNEGRKLEKRREKKPQSAPRLKLPFNNARSRPEPYPYPQQPHLQPVENGGASAMTFSDPRAETQQVRDERTYRGHSQGTTRRSTWEAWKPFRSSRSAGGNQSSRKKSYSSTDNWKFSRSSASRRTSTGHQEDEGQLAKNMGPQYNSAAPVPGQSFVVWNAPNGIPFDCVANPDNGYYHHPGAGATYHNSMEANNEQWSFESQGHILNDFAILEQNLGNVRLGESFSHPDEWMLESSLSYYHDHDHDLESAMDIDDPYDHLVMQYPPGYPHGEGSGDTGFYVESRLDFIAAAMGQLGGTPFVNKFEPMNPRNEDFYNFPHSFFPHSQVPPAFFPQESRPVQKDIKPVFEEASKTLELYNNLWSSIHQRTSSSPPPTILWPSKAPSFSRADLLTGTAVLSADLPKLTAYKFFCHAFGIHPLWNTRDDSGFELGFVTGEAQEKTTQKLGGLKNQLKLEKVRWHEDKVKAVFGEEAAGDECLKEVWGVVIDLKARVEKELGSFVGEKGGIE